MGMNSQFRRILSVLLLLLYGFIITPVALWHSRACEIAPPGKKLPLYEKQVGKAGHSCLICEHAYSSCTSTDDNREGAYVTEYHQYYDVYSTGMPSLVIPQCNTRGSPAVAPSFSLFT